MEVSFEKDATWRIKPGGVVGASFEQDATRIVIPREVMGVGVCRKIQEASSAE